MDAKTTPDIVPSPSIRCEVTPRVVVESGQGLGLTGG
jgi:hypothetical protein